MHHPHRHIPWPLLHQSWSTLAGTRNSSIDPPWRIDSMAYRTMSERSYHGATSLASQKRIDPRPATHQAGTRPYFACMVSLITFFWFGQCCARLSSQCCRYICRGRCQINKINCEYIHECMYVCMMCVLCMCICMYVCIMYYVCMYVCICMYWCMCICMYVCIHTWMRIRINMYVCMHVWMYIYTYVCSCLCEHILFMVKQDSIYQSLFRQLWTSQCIETLQ